MRLNFNDICVHVTVTLLVLKITGILPLSYAEAFAPIGLLAVITLLSYLYLSLTLKAKLAAYAAKHNKEE